MYHRHHSCHEASGMPHACMHKLRDNSLTLFYNAPHLSCSHGSQSFAAQRHGWYISQHVECKMGPLFVVGMLRAGQQWLKYIEHMRVHASRGMGNTSYLCLLIWTEFLNKSESAATLKRNRGLVQLRACAQQIPSELGGTRHVAMPRVCFDDSRGEEVWEHELSACIGMLEPGVHELAELHLGGPVHATVDFRNSGFGTQMPRMRCKRRSSPPLAMGLHVL